MGEVEHVCVDVRDRWNDRCAGLCGIAIVEAVDIGEQNQQIGVDVREQKRGELIVVTEEARLCAIAALLTCVLALFVVDTRME